ncbi:hypothetical protein LEMLEM_LOCUS26197, partial [Lemmus lemmus]
MSILQTCFAYHHSINNTVWQLFHLCEDLCCMGGLDLCSPGMILL